MPSTQTDNLFRLIKTMSKSEKRSFKLYVNRIGGMETAKFIQLFDVLDKQKGYDEESIFEKIPAIKRTQLSNLKRHLYKQILTSLRLIHISKNVDNEIREQMDFARILYGKGLFKQSLKVLDRVKTIAVNTHQDILHLQIIQFEKLIEGRHISRSMENRVDILSDESEKRGKIVLTTIQLSNLSLKLYQLYVKIGHIKDEKSSFVIKEIFKSNLPKIEHSPLTFFEKVYLNQAYVWYYFILQNFHLHYKYSQKWVDLFEEHPDMVQKDTDLYMRSLINLLNSHFYTWNYEGYVQTKKQLDDFLVKYKNKLNTNTEILAFMYSNMAQINQHFIEGSFSEGIKMIPNLNKELKKYKSQIDPNRLLIFYFKMGCMYFGSGDNGKAIDYLNEIINYRAGNVREDIQCYARILHLIAHYELGHFNLLEYLVKSVYRFLAKMEDLNAVQSEILKFLRRELYSSPDRLNKAFRKLQAKLEKLKTHPYERRSFLYLDISGWLQSKIEGKTVEEVSIRNFENRKRR